MCGICGFVGNTEPHRLTRMIRSIAHRGPDGTGTFHAAARPTPDGPELRVGLGHARLAVIDLSPAASQPMSNEDESLRIVCNGEIYNHLELRRRLESKGHRFKSRSDTEVLLHLYEERGTACLEDLRGMFAFALWDQRRQRLLLARDRLGIKPLYYVLEDKGLCFASEMKALLQGGMKSRRVDPRALCRYLAFLYVPSPMTILEGIEKLEPGHFLVWEKGRTEVSRYWTYRPSSFGADRLPEESLEKSTAEALEETVALHLQSDVPLGVFLSGGMDSSVLVGLIRRITGRSVKTFSIGYGEEARSYNELASSRLVAKHFRTEHREYILRPDVLGLLPRIVWHMDEPFGDSSAIPTYLVSRAAREEVTVALSGIGGDELFGGYPRYLGAHLAQFFSGVPPGIRNLASELSRRIPESTASRNLPGRLKRFLSGCAMTREDCYLSWISFLSEREAERLLNPDYASSFDYPDVRERHLAKMRELILEAEKSRPGPSPGTGRADVGYAFRGIDWMAVLQGLDLATYLPDDLLVMGDKMSMANGLELRVPYCDHVLVSRVMSIPSRVKYRGFKLKSLMKNVWKDLLPPEILGNQKRGFVVPLAVWLRKELRSLVEEQLSPRRVRDRGYFRHAEIRRILDEHYSGRRNHADLVYALVVLELWHQLYLD